MKYRKMKNDAVGVYEIYQIPDAGKISYKFMPFHEAKASFSKSHYKRVYTGSLLYGKTLNDLFEAHNKDDRPNGQISRSMSVSDVIVWIKQRETRAFYVDTFGFKDVTNEFLNNGRTVVNQKEHINSQER